MARNVMPRKIKFSKIAIVMFLTVLIWVYADLATEDTHLVPNVPVSISSSGDSELWATFKDEDGSPVSSITIKHIALKGPTSRITEVKRDQDNNLLQLAFFLDPERQDMTTAGSHTLDMLDFVREREQIRGLGGITVESCEPSKVTIEVVKLRKRDLNIRSVDESGKKALEAESITPSKVSMFVPEDWGQDKAAEVMLTPGEIQPARSKGVKKIPYIVLADGQKRQSDSYVQVKLLPEEDKLEQYGIGRVTVGYCFSANTQGKYKVESEDLRGEIPIRATLQAKQAYELEAYKIILEIYDNDAAATGWVSREYKYNFPEEYVRKGEIKLDPEHEPVEAKFKLIPQPSAENP